MLAPQEEVIEDVPPPPPGLTLEQAEFIRANVRFIGIQPMAISLGMTTDTLRKYIKKMGLESVKSEGMPEHIDMPFMPPNAVHFKTERGGTITRVPTGGAGIVSITYYTQVCSQDGRAEAGEEAPANRDLLEQVRRYAPSMTIVNLMKLLRSPRHVIEECLRELDIVALPPGESLATDQCAEPKRQRKKSQVIAEPRICNGSMTEIYNPSARQITTRYAR